MSSTTEYDAHLGYALIQITALVHFLVGRSLKEKGEQADFLSRISASRRSQSIEDYVRFCPSRALRGEFALTCARINSARGYPYSNVIGPTMTERMGGRPAAVWSTFPMHAKLPGVKVEVDVNGIDFPGATLTASVLEGELTKSNFNGAKCDSV